MHISRLALRRMRKLSAFVFVLLVIEFLDEFVFGAYEAALPVMRTDLGLSYEQIGLLLTLPSLFANLLIEPVLGILGDTWRRRGLVIGGGIGFIIALLLVAFSQNYALLMLSQIVFFPSSGAFVSLSQSTLMDINPERHEQNMARWTLAGSIGVVAGSIVIGGFIALGLGWRSFYVLAAAMSVITWIALWRMKFPAPQVESSAEAGLNLAAGFRQAFSALRRREVVRWLVLLEFSDLMLDVLHGYLALYFVDVVGIDEAQAGIAVIVWSVVGLVGDIALLPLLERVRGITYLRFSAALEFVLYTAFLVVPGLLPKLVLIGIIGFFNAGWYSILQGNLYTSMPGQSGAVLTLGTLFGVVHGFFPLIIGIIAGRFGLETAMVFPLIACVSLLVGLPRAQNAASYALASVHASEED